MTHPMFRSSALTVPVLILLALLFAAGSAAFG